MQSNLATLSRERRGHDRVHDAVYLHVALQNSDCTNSTRVVNADEPNRKVSLSASGIAFADKDVYQPGTQLAVSLVLFPSKQTIICQVTIVSAGDASEVANGELPTYRAVFADLTQAQASVLEDHVDALLSGLTAVAYG